MIVGLRFSAPETLQVSLYFCPAVGVVTSLIIQAETEGTERVFGVFCDNEILFDQQTY